MILGGSGPDLIFGGDGRDAIFAGSGPDTIYAGLGPTLVHGGSGPDLIVGGGANDTIFGGSGPDTVHAVIAGDHIEGSAVRGQHRHSLISRWMAAEPWPEVSNSRLNSPATGGGKTLPSAVSDDIGVTPIGKEGILPAWD